MANLSQYTTKKLANGKVEIYENGKAISSGAGYDPAYAAQFGYKDSAANPPKTMADYFGPSGGSGSSSGNSVDNEKNTDALSRIGEIKKQLGEAQNTLETYKAAGYTGENAKKDVKYNASGKIINAADAYSDYSSYDKAQSQYTSGLDKINTDLEDAKIKQKDAYAKLGTLKTSTYESAYSELGLGDKKAKVEKLDTDITAKSAAITAKTAERDKEFLDENGKPIAQWLITGDLKQIYDKYNNEITQLTNEKNTLATERNGLATEYNSGLDEVDKKVAAAVGDASADISYWDNQVSTLENKATNYQTQLMAILKGTEKGENNTTVVEANGKQYLVTYDTEGNVVSKQDLGTAKTSGSGAGSTPTSYDEWALAGGTEGTGQSYADWLTTSKGTKPEKETDISALENTKSTLNDLLANKSLKKVVNKGAWSNLPYTWENMSSEEKNVIGIIDQLISQSTLDALISAKAKGATFGALSDKESAMLRSAGSKIGSWTMENSKGKTLGYSIDEASFRKELTTLLELTNKAISAATGKTTAASSNQSNTNNKSNGFSSAYNLPWK